MEDDKKEIERKADAPLTKEEKDENTHAHEQKEVEIAYTAVDIMMEIKALSDRASRLENMMIDMHERTIGDTAKKREEQGGAKAVVEDEKGEKRDEKPKKQYSY